MYVFSKDNSTKARAGVKAQEIAGIEIRIRILLLLGRILEAIFVNLPWPASKYLRQCLKCIYKPVILISWLIVLKNKSFFLLNKLVDLLDL